MHPSRILILAGTALAALSLVLAQLQLPEAGPINGIDGESWPILILMAPVVLVALIGDWREGARSVPGVFAVAFGCLAVIFAVIKLRDAIEASRRVVDGSLQFGIWVLLIGALVVLAGTVLSLNRRVI